jgi:hypothetical protein
MASNSHGPCSRIPMLGGDTVIGTGPDGATAVAMMEKPTWAVTTLLRQNLTPAVPKSLGMAGNFRTRDKITDLSLMVSRWTGTCGLPPCRAKILSHNMCTLNDLCNKVKLDRQQSRDRPSVRRWTGGSPCPGFVSGIFRVAGS